ncbi:hypothetical protein ACFRMQ_22385 [Kitasatospora sp. NPDC056783]|uniref:hypothetical protein n=1 Tax=Kitasatospora sp. NPDC056783 TaxID=3345943 RepID=UPI0036BD1399
MPDAATDDRFEVHLIDSRSPHFRLLECWGIWDRERHDYLRVARAPERIERWYTVDAARAFHRLLHSSPPESF